MNFVLPTHYLIKHPPWAVSPYLGPPAPAPPRHETPEEQRETGMADARASVRPARTRAVPGQPRDYLGGRGDIGSLTKEDLGRVFRISYRPFGALTAPSWAS